MTDNPTTLPELDESEFPANEQPKKTKRVGPYRGYITAGNAHYLAFAGRFPGANTEAFSILLNRQENAFTKGGVLPTVGGTDKRLQKLVKLDALDRVRDAVARTNIYSLSPAGSSYAQEFGYDMTHTASLDRKAKSRLRHYRLIAHVAAQLHSPEGFFKESLGIGPVPLHNLIPEQQMNAPYKVIEKHLQAEAGKRGTADFGKWRREALMQVVADVKAGKIGWEDMIEVQPALLTVGHQQREGSKLKQVHQPDMTVLLENERTDAHAKNILVEVELSKKNWHDYDRILATLQAELARPYIYSRAVYFTVGKEIPNLLKKVDAAGEYNLIRDGKLVILPILDRNGVPIQLNPTEYNPRVAIGGN